MSLTDILLIGGIVMGALYLLYRSIWKKQGYCCGCQGGGCCPGKQLEDKGK